MNQIDSEISTFLKELIEFYGPASPQARTCGKIHRLLTSVSVADTYTKLCPTCKCHACGRTRAQAADYARSRQRRGFERYAQGKGLELSQPQGDDTFMDDTVTMPTGYTVMDIARAQKEAQDFLEAEANKYRK